MAATLSVVALGGVGRNQLEVAALGASSTFEIDTMIDPGLAAPKYAYNPGRDQHNAASILRKLGQSHLGSDRRWILAVGPFDLFDPETEFIFGDGDAHLRSAVIGTHRIHIGDDDRFMRRLIALATWAVGLALGLRDCDDSRCVMASPRLPDELEKRVGLLCGPCRQLLAKGGQI